MTSVAVPRWRTWPAILVVLVSAALAVVAFIFLGEGSLDYPGVNLDIRFVTAMIVVCLGVLATTAAALWQLRHPRQILDRLQGIADAATLGALFSGLAGAALLVVVLRIPSSGLEQVQLCPKNVHCGLFVRYGASRTELATAAGLFLADTLLLAGLSLWLRIGWRLDK